MSAENGSNGHVDTTAQAVLKLPTIEELRRAYEEGIPQTLLSGMQVQIRPVRPDKLLMAGKVPDILTPVVMAMLFPKEEEQEPFPDEIRDPVNHFLVKERKRADEAVEFIKAVDVVCEAAVVDPAIVPYLSIADRMWIFRLAWMPVEVLSNFRLQPQRDVEAGDDSPGEPQQAEPTAAVDRATG